MNTTSNLQYFKKNTTIHFEKFWTGTDYRVRVLVRIGECMIKGYLSSGNKSQASSRFWLARRRVGLAPVSRGSVAVSVCIGLCSVHRTGVSSYNEEAQAAKVFMQLSTINGSRVAHSLPTTYYRLLEGFRLQAGELTIRTIRISFN